MKNLIPFSVTLIVLALFTGNLLPSQVIFSRFDFNAIPYTAATIGPNATAIDADVTGDGAAIYIGSNCGAVKGIDLAIPNTASIFDQPEMGMTFRFRKLEARSDFFIRGGTSFYQSGGNLWVAFRTTDGGGGFIDYGPYNTAFAMTEDGLFHEYTFIYTAATGIATVFVDGIVVWTQDGPDNRDFYWTGAPNPLVGTVMDGNCNGIGFLDYAYFFIPSEPLPVNFNSFEASAQDQDAILNWTAENAMTGAQFKIERSHDGIHFGTVGLVPALPDPGSQSYRFEDANPGTGLFYYRIVQESGDGGSVKSEVRTVTIAGNIHTTMAAWPNPVRGDNGQLHILVANANQHAVIKVFDIKGTQVGADYPASTEILDINGLAPGIYFMRCECGATPIVQKVVVQ